MFVRSTKARWEKLKQFSTTLAEPISINSVLNSMNNQFFLIRKQIAYSKCKSYQNVKKDS